MADETGTVLRHSLDAVDRYRRRLIVGLVVTTVLLALALFATATHAPRSGGNVEVFLAYSVILLIWTGVMTLIVVLQIAAMTRRILRAIELTTHR